MCLHHLVLQQCAEEFAEKRLKRVDTQCESEIGRLLSITDVRFEDV